MELVHRGPNGPFWNAGEATTCRLMAAWARCIAAGGCGWGGGGLAVWGGGCGVLVDGGGFPVGWGGVCVVGGIFGDVYICHSGGCGSRAGLGPSGPAPYCIIGWGRYRCRGSALPHLFKIYLI